ncbi:MAG: hydantoinase B/oxoprolinase family protein [Alphaproteobacteria bacterium]
MTGADDLNARERIHMQVMWNRLIAVVEEQAQSLLRTAFGSVAREAGDLSAGVYNVEGRMLAQAVTGTPGHVNTMAVAVRHFLERFPLAEMREGDVFTTNDPWMGTGHLFDFVVVTPAFRRGDPVALFASTCHLVDVGGLGFAADARTVFEEGIQVPHMKLVDRGRLNETLMGVIQANVREPVEVQGDLLALVSCNEVGCARLVDMMDEFGLTSIDRLAAHIIEHSRAATLEAIRRLPAGTYTHEMTLDGYENEIRLVATMDVGEDGIHVDYDGSSPASDHGINSPKCYTDAYTVFGLKCIAAPAIPNNAGSLAPFTVSAPDDSIVDPRRPRAVTARHVIGQMLPELVFGCLHQAVVGGVPAEGAGSIWVLAMSGAAGGGVRPFNTMSVSVGGTGARPTRDGLSMTAFPSGVGAIPVEVTEATAPLLFRRRELRPDSGGAGRHRGGLGSVVEIESRSGAAFNISAGTFDRRRYAARGRDGGESGAKGRCRLESGRELASKAIHTVPAGDRLIVELPGGGGFGEPFERDPELVAREVRDGLLTPEAARSVYGVAASAEGALDPRGTRRLRTRSNRSQD